MKLEKRSRAALAAAILLAVLAMCLIALSQGKKQEPAQQGNLIENGDFSAVTDGMPDGWTAGMWVTSPGASYLEAVTLEDVYEPYLMQLGFLTRTPRGRCVTSLAYDHLHIPYEGQTQFTI